MPIAAAGRRKRRAPVLKSLRHMAVSLFFGLTASACSLLVQFRDAPTGSDASTVEPSDAGRQREDSSFVEPDPEDANTPPLDANSADGGRPNTVFTGGTNACTITTSTGIRTPGFYCASQPKVSAYLGKLSNHLVECIGTDATDVTTKHSITVCVRGCVPMPPGVPDICDDCDGKPDGDYCAAEFRYPWFSQSADGIVKCVGGRAVTNTGTKCPDSTSCKATGIGKAACKAI
jgi:hypothetical protein